VYVFFDVLFDVPTLSPKTPKPGSPHQISSRSQRQLSANVPDLGPVIFHRNFPVEKNQFFSGVLPLVNSKYQIVHGMFVIYTKIYIYINNNNNSNNNNTLNPKP